MNVKHAELEKQQTTILKSHEERVRLLEYFQDHDGSGFGQFFSKWGLDIEANAEMPAQPWCEDVFRTHPWEAGLEKDHGLFNALTRYELRQTAVWYNIHVKMIEKGILKGHFFAYDRSNSKFTGLNNIKQALAAKTDQSKAVDKCARNILRNMGGIPRVRGRRVINDCPTAKFYWNYKFACDVEEELKGCEIADKLGGQKKMRRRIYEALQGTIWEALVDILEFRMTIFGNRRILAALVAHIMLENSGRSEIQRDFSKDGKTITRLGPTTNVRHLQFAKPDEIVAIFKEVKV